MSFQRTKIEYLTHTSNPIAMRCTPVSEGCKHCWHITRANLLSNNPTISLLKRKIYINRLDPRIFDLHIPKGSGRRIGVQFMGDLFHDSISREMLYGIFTQFLTHPHDIFIILTKRPGNLKSYIESNLGIGIYWPLPNVWLGVTCENQRTADERIPILLQIPATVRWVSIEPMLERMDLTTICPHDDCHECNGDLECSQRGLNTLTGELRYYDDDSGEPCSYWGNSLHWVVCGAETGPGKRPMDIMWAADLLAQCKEAGVPFFFKKDSTGKYDPNFPREYPK